MNTFEKIYAIVSTIPKGKVMTYKQVAVLTGINPLDGGARVVGFALRANKNPKTIPCHRVVGSSGKLTGYAFGGIEEKKKILQNEGVLFLDNETVNIQQSVYETN